MWRFYISLLKGTPALFFRGHSWIRSIVALVLFLRVLFNQSWATWRKLKWDGLSPWWALAIFNLLARDKAPPLAKLFTEGYTP